MTDIETIERDGIRGILYYDDYPPNPITEYDGFFGTILYNHRRYDLEGCIKVEGDNEAFYIMQRDYDVEITCRHCDLPLSYEGDDIWVEDTMDWRERDDLDVCSKAPAVEYMGNTYHEHSPQPNGVTMLPIFGYDHGALSISTSEYGDPWDSGRLGLIFIKNDDGFKLVGHHDTDEYKKYLKSSVEEYNQFINGEVYRYAVERIDNHEFIASCGGFYDEDDCKSEMIAEMECAK